jgi:hypothetical protein
LGGDRFEVGVRDIKSREPNSKGGISDYWTEVAATPDATHRK